VAKLLNKLLIRFTKSRPRHTNDNGLVESKNGAAIRKNLGYAYIPQACADALNQYNRDFLNPYINFHRPCFFSVSVIDHRGKIKKTYPYQEVMTPYEKLKSLPTAASSLQPGITMKKLDDIANQMSDNEFAERMVKARSNLFQHISQGAWGSFFPQAHSWIRKDLGQGQYHCSHNLYCRICFRHSLIGQLGGLIAWLSAYVRIDE
jgi:hypothetical protein